MAENRYKKYKFIKKEIAFNQNQMSLDTVEESSRIMAKQHNVSRKRIIFDSFDSSDSSNKSQSIELSHMETPINAHHEMRKDEGHQFAVLSRQYVELKYDVKQILNRLESIERLLNTTLTAGSSHSGLENDFLNQLPLESVTSINDFDAIISENTEKFNSLVQLLYLVGGNTNKKIIFNMLRKIIKNEAATHYSGQGKRKKLSFVNLKIYGAVMTAARRRENSITEVEILHYVSVFLATAKSRL